MSSGDDEDAVCIELVDSGDAYTFTHEAIARRVETANMCSAEIHAGIHFKEKRPGVAVLRAKYVDFEMPASVYLLLVNVAEFGFKALSIQKNALGEVKEVVEIVF